MSTTAQMMMREYAQTRWPTLNHKGRMWRLKDVLRWTDRRTRALYNNEQGMRVRAEELAALEALKTQEAKDDISKLNTRLSRLETLLAVSDEAFHRHQIEGLRQHLRRDGGMAD